MKGLFAVLGVCLLAGEQVRADIYSGAKQQARNASGAITARDNQAVSESSPASPSPSPPANDPVLQATLRNIANLSADFAGLGNATDTNAAAAQKQMLINDLAAACTGAKPSSASVAKLADDLAVVVAGNEKLRAQQPRLARDVHAIFNSSHLSAAQQEMVCDDVQKLLQNSGAPSDNITSVVIDLKGIASATK